MKRKKEEEGDWMITYTALMLVLLTFLAILVALATVSQQQTQLALASIREKIGISPEELARIERERRKILTMLEELGEGGIEVRITSEGIILDIKSPILFKIAKADLRPKAYPVLEKVADIARKIKPDEIEVSGHTCDLPIHTYEFPSNWELSAGRALAVLKVLKSRWLSKAHISAAGCGEYRPGEANINEESRKQNRRVEIYLRYGKRR